MCKLNQEEIANLGKFLKKLRNNKKKTTREVAEFLSYSQGHISGIENGKRGIPSETYIEDVITFLSDTFEEYNFNIDQLKEVTNDKIQLLKSDVNEKIKNNSMLESFTDNNEAPNIMYMENNLGLKENTFFSIPINDLNFHLNDISNSKYYRKLKLTDIDRKHINDYINNYLINKIRIQLENVQNLYKQNLLNKQTHSKYSKELKELIEKLENPNDLKY